MKKNIWIVVVFVCIVLQVGFIYAMVHGGKERFLLAYESMKMPVSAYTQFVLHHLEKFWALPFLSLVLLAVSIKRKSFLLQVLIVVLSIVLIVGVYVAQPLIKLGSVGS